jgi:hypothetical protein
MLLRSSLKNRRNKFHLILISFFISYTQTHTHTHTHIFTSITQYLSVADNARDAVFLHVSASSEKQERRNETELKKRTKHEIVKHHDVYVSLCIVVLFHSVSGYTFTFTSCFISDNHIITKTKHLPQIIL